MPHKLDAVQRNRAPYRDLGKRFLFRKPKLMGRVYAICRLFLLLLRRENY